MGTEYSFYITCATGLESLLAEELKQLPLERIRVQGAGVRCEGTLAGAYRACMHSRVANRVLMPVHQGPVDSPESLYALIQQVDWSEHLQAHDTLAVDGFVANSVITHSQYAALTVKDAIVDQFREKSGVRPSVERDRPNVRINIYIFRDTARIAIDLSGTSLHRRGYRQQQGRAPLKENLAAALLLSLEWPQRASRGARFVDPMCGSGTLLIEAALMASQRAPGLSRDYFGFQGWLQHDAALWSEVESEALAAVIDVDNLMQGYDSDRRAIEYAADNARVAGVDQLVQFKVQDVHKLVPVNTADSDKKHLLLSNPPYGERLQAGETFYEELGKSISRAYAGWTAALIVSDLKLLKHSRLPLKDRKEFKNGAIPCVLASGLVPKIRSQEIDIDAFVNRLAKNQRKLKPFLKQTKVQAYRLYDADLPEFAVAIDIYECEQRCVVVQEYQAPESVNAAMAEQRLGILLNALPQLLDVSKQQIHVKLREKQSGLDQYEKTGEERSVGVLNEFGYSLSLNFSDYLDTGLFLDHRKVRRYVGDQAKNKRFLNLFSYTSSVTVAAIAGGATSTVSVDLSKNYCEWSQRNFNLNGFDSASHQIIRTDVMTWLNSQANEPVFDLILLDPPTFSNSSALERDWDVQTDHVSCLLACMDCLASDGVLIFSTNYRRFKLDVAGLEHRVQIEDRSRWSIDKDFERNQRIHKCWFIRHR
ncbi:MAG: bifunctional 23S rRNA (guanine(2069)-N(7))-methyltransferase RlmK/23S rRNA (guanine(2445)-N(2))-methyltransferase RlmL [Gammaproteobacteria bacterium]|nr:bifunctional 23S rRNA (guanine(2069)-N(7))-methyltransferase RlmK/23S rRNA (guanine(2445)-N(2))-methyltransferase RlmL [Gammaproteobacteria bacterium]